MTMLTNMRVAVTLLYLLLLLLLAAGRADAASSNSSAVVHDSCEHNAALCGEHGKCVAVKTDNGTIHDCFW